MQLEQQNIIKPIICQHIKDRVMKYNKNFLGIAVGETGSGKSYMTLRMAELIDPDFNIDRVVFSTEDFLKLIKEGLETDKLKRGSVIIYDEMGIGHSSRNFYDAVNKALNFVFQGFRKENYIVFMTAPKLKFIDIQVRELAHFIFIPKMIDKKHNLLWCNAFKLGKNELFGKSYTSKPLIASEAGITKLNEFGLGLPSEKLRQQYEHKKRLFLNTLYEESLMKARMVREMTEMALSKSAIDNSSKTDIPLFVPKNKRRFIKMAGKQNRIRKQIEQTANSGI